MRHLCPLPLCFVAALMTFAVQAPEAHAGRADQVLEVGSQVCETLARNAKADPNRLREARRIMEQLAQEKRAYAKLAHASTRANDKARDAQDKYRNLERKLAEDCKGKRGPICYLTRKRADHAKKTFDKRVAEFRTVDESRRAAERRLDQMASAALTSFRRLQAQASRR